MLYYIDNNAQLTFFSLLSCNVTIQHYEKHVGIGKVLFSSLFLFLFIHFPSIGEKARYTERYIDETLQSKITDLRTKKSNQFYKKERPLEHELDGRRQVLQRQGKMDEGEQGDGFFQVLFACRCTIGVLYQRQFTNNTNVCKYSLQ